MCRGIAGRQLQCSPKAVDRLPRITLCVQSIAQVVVKLGNVRPQRDRPPDILNGHFLVTRFIADYAEQMQRIGMIRIDADLSRYSLSACCRCPVDGA